MIAAAGAVMVNFSFDILVFQEDSIDQKRKVLAEKFR
jgi:hypothetical protein